MEYRPVDLEVLRRAAFGRCRAAGASVEDAQDCAQDAIASLLAHPEVEHPKTWVATVAYHRYIDACRLRGREGSAGLVPAAAAITPEPTGPEEEVIGRAHASWLVGAMAQLPASTRTVCSAVGTGMARQEVANRLGLTDRAVESHLTRARRSLRALSLLTIVAVIAAGRALRRLIPVSKPAVAALVAPPFAVVIMIGAGERWGGSFLPERPQSGAAPPAAVQPAPERPATGPGLVRPALKPDGPTRSSGPSRSTASGDEFGLGAQLSSGLTAPAVPMPVVPMPDVPVPGVPVPGVPVPGVPVPDVPMPGVPVPGVPVPGVAASLPPAVPTGVPSSPPTAVAPTVAVPPVPAAPPIPSLPEGPPVATG